MIFKENDGKRIICTYIMHTKATFKKMGGNFLPEFCIESEKIQNTLKSRHSMNVEIA